MVPIESEITRHFSFVVGVVPDPLSEPGSEVEGIFQPRKVPRPVRLLIPLFTHSIVKK